MRSRPTKWIFNERDPHYSELKRFTTLLCRPYNTLVALGTRDRMADHQMDIQRTSEIAIISPSENRREFAPDLICRKSYDKWCSRAFSRKSFPWSSLTHLNLPPPWLNNNLERKRLESSLQLPPPPLSWTSSTRNSYSRSMLLRDVILQAVFRNTVRK